MIPQLLLDLLGEHSAQRFRKGVLTMADLFAGAGGTSLGALLAFRELRLDVQLAAVNHWLRAVQSHSANFDGHLHFCTGVDKISVKDLFLNTADGLFALWASPSCTNFSQARGGVPINEQDRSTLWAVVKWLRAKRAIHCFVENVAQVQDYGPLTQKRDPKGRPLFLKKDEKGIYRRCYAPGASKVRPSNMTARQWWKTLEPLGYLPAMEPILARKGEYFRKWVKQIRRLGYLVEWRVLRCADFGAPTRRARFFLQAVLKESGRKIVWPNPTHAEPDAEGRVPAGLRRWAVTDDILIKTDVGTSIFTRKRRLADKTIDRIAIGIWKYGVEPHIVKLKGTGTANSTKEPLHTVQAGGTHYALSTARTDLILPQQRGGKGQLRVKSTAETMGAITTTGAEAFARAEITNVDFAQTRRCVVEVNHGNGREGDNGNMRRARSTNEPLGALTTSRSHAVATSSIGVVETEVEQPTKVTSWRELSEAIKKAITRAKLDPEYRPILSIRDVVVRLEVFFRMLRWRELARAQSFPDWYEFVGTETEIIRQIGNAVPPMMSRALVLAAVSQNPDITPLEMPTVHLRAA